MCGMYKFATQTITGSVMIETCKVWLQVASLIGADPKEIIFTSGATEANNLAIKGVANFYKEKKNHIITLQTDHKCVLDSCRYLQHRGFKVTYLPVKKDGLVDLQLLADSITPETVMVSVMMINNEIGEQRWHLYWALHVLPLRPLLSACPASTALCHDQS